MEFSPEPDGNCEEGYSGECKHKEQDAYDAEEEGASRFDLFAQHR
jgi:hypothetical protein